MLLIRIPSIIIFLLFGWTVSSQNLYLKISGLTKSETTTIDSIGYLKTHPDTKSIVTETNALSEKLSRMGYIANLVESNIKENDSTFRFHYNLGKKTSFIHLYIGSNLKAQSLALFDQKNDTIVMPYGEIESFLNQTLGRLEKKGYALAKLQLVTITNHDDYVSATLQLTISSQRTLSNFVINGYPKFPEGHKANIRRLYHNKTFNQDNLKKVYNDFEKFRFVKQVKYPEILFEKDSTKIYIYLEKAKSNTFDGFIGFSNSDNNKVRLNGYVDLVLNNILNTGEKFTLYWKSDGNDQKTFNAAVELPYIFKSPFGLKAQLNIFKQDSTFQNTKTAIDLGYFLNYNTRIYLGYQSTESSDIQNINTASISDFKNSFVTANFEYLDFKSDAFLFPEKTNINIKTGFGSRSSKINRSDQFFINIDLKHNLYLNEKNVINIKTQNFYLSSDEYIVNELQRFGGINSIRGFNENSLQANVFSAILTEYRYVLNPGIYAHTIIDYGYYKDNTTNNSGNLLGLGFGVGLLTKTGLFNLIYANGSTKEQAIKFSNSIVHISFKTNF